MQVKSIFIAIILLFFFFEGAQGDPSGPIKRAMDTPATVFDLFLHEIEAKWQCPPEHPLFAYCLEEINYSYSDNLFYMEFSVSDGPIWSDPQLNPIKNFYEEGSEEKKKEILRTAIKVLAKQFPVIFAAPIRRGWSKEGFDEEEFKSEVLSRTVLLLTVTHGQNIYTAKKEQRGEISISVHRRLSLDEVRNLEKKSKK